MKKLQLLTMLSLLFSALAGFSQTKIGDNPTTIGASSCLELESSSKGLVVTRVADVSVIQTPTNGMIIYVVSENKFKIYQNNNWTNMFP